MMSKKPIQGFVGKHFFLSNFAPIPVIFDGWEYPTAEHAFQAAKTLDANQRAKIQAASTPGWAKGIGRHVALRPGWDEEVRDVVMRKIIKSKFSRPMPAAAMLLQTGDRELIEANHWHDNYWGNCTCGNSSVCRKPGENRLGILLMKRRDKLRKGSK